ncbi:hypothetical protein [Desulfocicer niacini]
MNQWQNNTSLTPLNPKCDRCPML